MDDLDRMVALREAAALLAISVRTLERFIADGKVPQPVKIGRKRVYPVSAVETMIDLAKRGRLCH